MVGLAALRHAYHLAPLSVNIGIFVVTSLATSLAR